MGAVVLKNKLFLAICHEKMHARRQVIKAPITISQHDTAGQCLPAELTSMTGFIS